jgi:hypothetical protein
MARKEIARITEGRITAIRKAIRISVDQEFQSFININDMNAGTAYDIASAGFTKNGVTILAPTRTLKRAA